MILKYYPAFIDLKGKNCVVVGGGKVAERKALSLLRAGARVTVISPEITASLDKKKTGKAISHIKRAYRKGDLADAFLVIAATSDEGTNKEVSGDAPGLVNVADVPSLANFIAPSVVQSGPLTIAVSTSGASPAMASSIRKELETLYGKDFASFIAFLKGLRKKALKELPDKKARETFLKESASPGVLARLRSAGLKKITADIMTRFEAARQSVPKTVVSGHTAGKKGRHAY